MYPETFHEKGTNEYRHSCTNPAYDREWTCSITQSQDRIDLTGSAWSTACNREKLQTVKGIHSIRWYRQRSCNAREWIKPPPRCIVVDLFNPKECQWTRLSFEQSKASLTDKVSVHWYWLVDFETSLLDQLVSCPSVSHHVCDTAFLWKWYKGWSRFCLTGKLILSSMAILEQGLWCNNKSCDLHTLSHPLSWEKVNASTTARSSRRCKGLSGDAAVKEREEKPIWSPCTFFLRLNSKKYKTETVRWHGCSRKRRTSVVSVDLECTKKKKWNQNVNKPKKSTRQPRWAKLRIS